MNDELTIKISNKLKRELNYAQDIWNYDPETTINLVLDKYLVNFIDAYLHNVVFSNYKEDLQRLEKIFQGNSEILQKLKDIHKSLEDADEDQETEILTVDYGILFAELYRDYEMVRNLHKSPFGMHECSKCGVYLPPKEEKNKFCSRCR